MLFLKFQNISTFVAGGKWGVYFNFDSNDLATSIIIMIKFYLELDLQKNNSTHVS